MPVLVRLGAVFLVMGVILLPRARPCWAVETTERGASGTVYGGAGKLVEGNNESGPDRYDVSRGGVGVLAVHYPFWSHESAASASKGGLFVPLGASFELEETRHTACYFSCQPAAVGSKYLAKNIAVRAGVGYSLRLFEFRVGALMAVPDPNISYASLLVFPDVMARVGDRSIGWFELGLGAYDASTNFRPGLYVGAALGSPGAVQVSGHFGIHLVNGLCCSSVVQPGYRGELSLMHAFSSRVSASAGAAVYGASQSEHDALVTEGTARLSLAF